MIAVKSKGRIHPYWQALLLASLLLSACQAKNEATLNATAKPPTIQPTIFQDEFDGNTLNRQKWTTQHGWGRTNRPELEYYTDEALVVKNGILTIKAEARPIENMAYSSGMINSVNSFTFTYGYVEARVQIPSGRGLWPALWLLDAGGSADEIDMMEVLGHEPTIVYMTLHYADASGEPQGTADGKYQGADLSNGFHTLGLDWQAAGITWYIDGVERYHVTEHIPNKPMYLIANLAVGGDWPGSPDESTGFPAFYQIDHIRIFKTSQP